MRIENLTYRQLKELVPATPKGKVPSTSDLKGKEILFSEHVYDADITIFKNGYLTYTMKDGFCDPCTTVYSVHMCSNIVQKTGASKSEMDEECGSTGQHSKLLFRIINGQATRFVITNEDEYDAAPWWMPIHIICDERIRKNLDDREARRTEPLNDDDYNFDPSQTDSDSWLEAVIESERDLELHNRLSKALKKLTDAQLKTIQVLFQNGEMTERKAAQILGTTSINVHKNKHAALKNLRKTFLK